MDGAIYLSTGGAIYLIANDVGMAFREFVSNAIDAAIAVNKQAGNNVKWPW